MRLQFFDIFESKFISACLILLISCLCLTRTACQTKIVGDIFMSRKKDYSISVEVKIGGPFDLFSDGT